MNSNNRIHLSFGKLVCILLTFTLLGSACSNESSNSELATAVEALEKALEDQEAILEELASTPTTTAPTTTAAPATKAATASAAKNARYAFSTAIYETEWSIFFYQRTASSTTN